MLITVVGKSLSFPRICACCAGPADITQDLAGSQKIGNRRYTKLGSSTGIRPEQ